MDRDMLSVWFIIKKGGREGYGGCQSLKIKEGGVCWMSVPLCVCVCVWSEHTFIDRGGVDGLDRRIRTSATPSPSQSQPTHTPPPPSPLPPPPRYPHTPTTNQPNAPSHDQRLPQILPPLPAAQGGSRRSGGAVPPPLVLPLHGAVYRLGVVGVQAQHWFFWGVVVLVVVCKGWFVVGGMGFDGVCVGESGGVLYYFGFGLLAVCWFVCLYGVVEGWFV